MIGWSVFLARGGFEIRSPVTLGQRRDHGPRNESDS
jgi:hypothetical protein